MKLMIIKNCQQFLDDTSRLIKKHYKQCRIFTCKSGIEALETAKAYLPDIILIDSSIIDTDITSLVQEIRLLDENVQILILTDWNKSKFIEKTSCYGVHYISKPLVEKELLFKIKASMCCRNAVISEKNVQGNYALQIAERKLVEQALKDSEMKFRTLFESSSDAIMILDSNKFFECNNATLKIFCYSSKEEFINKHPCDLSPPVQPDGVDSFTAANWHIEKALKNGTNYYQWMHKKKDGTVFPSEILLSKFNLKGRDVLQAVVRDITERKKIEGEMRKREQEFKALVENAPDIIARFDKEHKCIYVNPAVEKELGIPQEEIIGNKKNVFGITDDGAVGLRQRDILRDIFTKEKVKNVYTYFMTPKGEKYFYTRVVPEINIDGEVETVLSITRDITDRKLGEEVLRKSKEQYQKLVELLPDAIMVHYNCKIVFANTFAAKLLGVESPDVLIGNSILDFLHRDYWKIAKELNKQVEEEGRVTPLMEQKIISKNREIIDIEVASIPIIYQNRQKVLSVIRDITERKKMEEEIQKTSKLESIGILAGGIAHDFNNILTIILGNISLAQIYANNNEKILNKLEGIEKATMQAKELTQQLHTFAKGGEPVKKTVSLKKLVKEAVLFSLSGSNVRCEFCFHDGLMLAEVDEGQVRQVINNLILNAVQAMPQGGTVRVRLKNEVVEPGKEEILPLNKGKYVQISIEDEGMGIERKHLQKIFDPFFTTKDKGTGLGLATAYSVVKKHGGNITAKSQPGEGSIFQVYLPASSEKNLPVKKKEIVCFGGKGKILVMDDEVSIREIVGEMLSFLKYETDFAQDGQEALDKYMEAKKSGSPFDAVIMDLTIPGGMGGKDAVKKLLEIDPEVKVIVSSGYSHDPVMSYYNEYGFSGVVKKPYKIQELAQVLHKLVQV